MRIMMDRIWRRGRGMPGLSDAGRACLGAATTVISRTAPECFLVHKPGPTRSAGHPARRPARCSGRSGPRAGGCGRLAEHRPHSRCPPAQQGSPAQRPRARAQAMPPPQAAPHRHGGSGGRLTLPPTSPAPRGRGRGGGRRGGTRSRRRGPPGTRPPRWAPPTPSSTSPCARTARPSPRPSARAPARAISVTGSGCGCVRASVCV